MKRTLNKILCFMWGHQPVMFVWGIAINMRRFGGDSILCKHCGAHKHD